MYVYCADSFQREMMEETSVGGVDKCGLTV